MASCLKSFVLPKSVVRCLLFFILPWNIILVCGESEVITEDNWDVVLKGHWMIKFYAPWCPACRNLRPTWDKFAIKAETLNVRVAEVDVTKNAALSGRFGIVSLPTVYHAINGEFRLYKDERKLDGFVNFIQERKWEDMEAIPSWKSPGSFLMSILGLVFKAAEVFKDIHTALTETYGLPAWGSYVIFGVGTVLVGLILGMILVFVSDYVVGTFWPVPEPNTAVGSEQKDPVVDTKDERKQQTENDAEEDDEKVVTDQDPNDGTVRKRGKKLKATME